MEAFLEKDSLEIIDETEQNNDELSEVNESSITMLKRQFREWCAVLSIEEIMSNPILIRSIERVEQKLLAAGA